jgi:hypothetical protein
MPRSKQFAIGIGIGIAIAIAQQFEDADHDCDTDSDTDFRKKVNLPCLQSLQPNIRLGYDRRLCIRVAASPLLSRV